MEGLDTSLVTNDGMDKDNKPTKDSMDKDNMDNKDSMDMDAIFLSEIVTED